MLGSMAEQKTKPTKASVPGFLQAVADPQQRADALYRGVTPLVAQDVAELIGFVASRPPHVNIDQIVVKPRDQASATRQVNPPAAG